MVEAQLSDDLPFGLLIIFSICTTLVVAIHLLALMISTCILPNMEAVSNVHNVTAVLESPHEKMHWYIELAWIFSTGVGILLFLVEMCILAWVRFLPSNSNCCEGSGEGATQASPSKWRYAAPISSTIIIVPCLFIFIVFAIRFYRQLITHKYERHTQGLEELDNMASELNASNVQAPLNSHNMQIVWIFGRAHLAFYKFATCTSFDDRCCSVPELAC